MNKKQLLIRTITGAVLVAVMGGFFLLRKIDVRFFDIALYLFALIGTFEFVNSAKDKLNLLQKIALYVFSAAVLPVKIFTGYFIYFLLIYALVYFTICIFSGATLESIAYGVLIAVYPNLLLIAFVNINGFCEYELSTVALITVFACSCLSDVFAYLVGSILKGDKLCPSISPNKTVSGAIGGIIGGIIGAVVVALIFDSLAVLKFQKAYIAYIFAVGVGILGGIFTEIGDLTESYFKRQLGVKDFGKLLPGHGGILDRIDGLLFCSNVIYFLFSFFA